VVIADDAAGVQFFVREIWRMLAASRLGHSGLYVDDTGNPFHCASTARQKLHWIQPMTWGGTTT